jgi:hypothetical protein
VVPLGHAWGGFNLELGNRRTYDMAALGHRLLAQLAPLNGDSWRRHVKFGPAFVLGSTTGANRDQAEPGRNITVTFASFSVAIYHGPVWQALAV